MVYSMNILRKRLLAGARQAEGVAVVIDVFRAFTSAAVMFYLGVEKILLQADPREALELKRTTGYLAAGEVDGKDIPGFDLGNSPSRMLTLDRAFFEGKTVIQRTSAGVLGAIAACQRADQVILASYVIAKATASYIRRLSPQPETISLVAMGNAGSRSTPDDEGCADYLEHLLTGKAYDHLAALQAIMADECAQAFLRGDRAYLPPADAVYCLQRDLFDFALVVGWENGRPVTRRENVHD
jgi:2-phosphosulfolactate phosphatase